MERSSVTDTAYRRRAEHRNRAGLARDLDVEPALRRYAGPRFQLARGINSALFPNGLGDELFRNLSVARIRDRALVVARLLESNREVRPDGRIVAAGDLARQVAMAVGAGGLQERADVLRGQAAAHVTGVLGPWLQRAAEGAGPIGLTGEAGAEVDAGQLAEALAALPQRGVALPVFPELLVTAERASRARYTRDEPALGRLLAGARDVRHVELWAPSKALPASGVHLGRIVDQLRTATCPDPAVLAGVRELADFVRQQARGELRSRQAVAAASEREELAAEAAAVAAILREQYSDTNVPTSGVAVTLLEGIRILTDVLAWDSHFDDRAVAVRTGDRDEDESVWQAWSRNGRRRATVDTEDPAGAGLPTATTDKALRSLLATTNAPRRKAHAARGRLLRPDNSRLTITRIFAGTDGADVVRRFRETGSCWFEIPVTSLPVDADGTARYHEAVAAGISVRLVGARCRAPYDLEVRHSGAGWLRLIEDDRVVEQPLAPEAVLVRMHGEASGTFGLVPGPANPAFMLAGRAIAAPWSLRLPDGGADLSGLTAIEVQIDLEAFVPAGAVTLRRIHHPAELLVPGTTVEGTVELTGAAPAGGLVVTFTSTHPEIFEPPSAVVAAGAVAARFEIVAHAPTGENHVVLTAHTPDGASVRTVLEIADPPSSGVERTALAAAAPGRAITTLGDRTFVVVDDDDAVAAGLPIRSVVALDDALAPLVTARAGIGTRAVAADFVRNRLYVVNAGAHGPDGFRGAGVTMLDATSLGHVAEWSTGAGVDLVAVDSAAGLVYVTHRIGRRLFVLDADDLTLRDVIGDNTFTGACGLAADPGLDRIYVARTERRTQRGGEVDALTVIERRPDGRHEVSRTISLGPLVQPWRVAVDPVLGLVYVIGLGSGGVQPQLIVLDRATLAERGRVNTIPGLADNRALATRDGTGIVHVTGDAGVQVIDCEAMAVVGFVPSAETTCVAASGGDHVVSASARGELVRLRAPRQITTTEWR